MPYALTVDYDTLSDKCVTLRERDTMTQVWAVCGGPAARHNVWTKCDKFAVCWGGEGGGTHDGAQEMAVLVPWHRWVCEHGTSSPLYPVNAHVAMLVFTTPCTFACLCCCVSICLPPKKNTGACASG